MQRPSKQPEKKEQTKSRQAALTFLTAALLIAGIWGIVLPQVAALPTMQEKTRYLDEKGIDPGAFFYTDHPNTFQITPQSLRTDN